MKFMFATVLATGLATGLATSAIASGPVTVYEPPAPIIPVAPAAYDWSGAYYGATLGYGETRHRVPGTATVPDANGGLVGGVIGYNMQSGNMVYGAEAALNWANLSGTAPCTNPAFTCTSDVNALGALRGRLGYANDRTLFYVSGGLGLARIEHSTTSGGPVFTDANTRTGWTLGMGIEQAMNNGWSVRGQVDYYRFSGSDYVLDTTYADEHTNIGTATISVLRRF